MSEVIVSSVSPLTLFVVEVIVENDCSYFYLYQPRKFNDNILATCWIKNHVKVDGRYSMQNDMKKGLQPKVPTKHCAYESDLVPLQQDALEIVWGKEGSMAALYENGELLCVIPYLPGYESNGYSKYSNVVEDDVIPLSLESPDASVLVKIMDEAKAFWEQDFNVIWKGYQESYLSELESKYGKYLKYYAIDGGTFPPKALVLFEKDSIKYAFTLGVGIFPQPVDICIEDRKKYEFFEIGFAYVANANFNEHQVLSQISVITMIPWINNTFLANHHTVDLVINTRYYHAVAINDKCVNAAQFEFLDKRNVNLLWMVPVVNRVYEKLTSEPPDYSAVDIMAANSDIVFLLDKSRA